MILLANGKVITRDSEGVGYLPDGGVVTTAGWHYSYGNYVIINHGGGRQTLYAHASSLAVHVGQAVSQGQVIAKVGSTGYSTGPHLHLELKWNGLHLNPAYYVEFLTG